MVRPTTRTAGLLAGTAALTLGLAACGSSEPAPPPDAAAAGKVQVVASTDVWGSVASAVGGDRVAVTSIINSPDKDPHEYESTPADAAAVEKAQLLLRNGGGYDDFMTKLVDTSGNRAPVVDAVAVSGLQPAGEEQHAEGEHGHEHAHGEFNEHVWYSLPTVQKVARSVVTELGKADPAGAAAYTANAQRFDASVAQLASRAAAVGTAHPGATVAVTEPVPDYLLDAAKLRDVTPPEFSEAVEEGNDPPAAVLQQTLAVLSAQPRVGALVLNAQTRSPTTDQVEQAATRAGVPVVEMSETLPAGTTDYTAWMGGQIDRLSAALDRR
ncbi:MAG: zinc ABC transporter substrate-binding protein [Actinomycetota bacterium]|nr:zinc ABC transporter substrate-binding protein [Actinomycetota bacterium]